MPVLFIIIFPFHSGKPAGLYEQENPDWAPTKQMGQNAKDDETPRSVERYQRAKRRLETKSIRQMTEPSEEMAVTPLAKKKCTTNKRCLDFKSPADEENKENRVNQTKNVAVQTDLTMEVVGAMEADLKECLKTNFQLKSDLSKQNLDIDSFKNEDDKTKYYTGLSNFTVLITLYSFLQAHISECIKLTKFQQLILVLMRLRVNCPVQDLAYRFRISVATVSRAFLNVIDIMNSRLNFLIKWPTRDQLQKTMPLSFMEHFGKRVAVVIDCFEVFIERPSNLKARAQTWSSYKHHNTVKFLLGITPQGVISFLSKAWGGRASDKHVTERCGILDKLLPGDLVLADRGFNIAESVGMQQAQLNIPAFTKGKDQLSAVDVETTRKIAHVRIHVERVIGSVRQKYQILQSIIPVTLLCYSDAQEFTTVDKIAHVCCALTNLSDSVVPRD